MEWYEPGEDTYTLLDVIEAEKLKSKIILDMGCSTGVFTELLEKHNLVISSDINIKALRQIKDRNVICTALFDYINQETIDVCIFNPPYVPDFDCPILGGGEYGREVIDKFVEQVNVKSFFLLIIKANKPDEVVENIKKREYEVKIKKIREILGETIIIIFANKKSK